MGRRPPPPPAMATGTLGCYTSLVPAAQFIKDDGLLTGYEGEFNNVIPAPLTLPFLILSPLILLLAPNIPFLSFPLIVPLTSRPPHFTGFHLAVP